VVKELGQSTKQPKVSDSDAELGLSLDPATGSSAYVSCDVTAVTA